MIADLPARTDPALLADIGRALDQLDGLVWLNTECDLALLGHLDDATARLVTAPYQPGALKTLAAERAADR